LFCENCSAITRRVLHFHKGMTYTWDEVAGHRGGGPETAEPTWPEGL
jgi:hypothetical protein